MAHKCIQTHRHTRAHIHRSMGSAMGDWWKLYIVFMTVPRRIFAETGPHPISTDCKTGYDVYLCVFGCVWVGVGVRCIVCVKWRTDPCQYLMQIDYTICPSSTQNKNDAVRCDGTETRARIASPKKAHFERECHHNGL